MVQNNKSREIVKIFCEEGHKQGLIEFPTH